MKNRVTCSQGVLSRKSFYTSPSASDTLMFESLEDRALLSSGALQVSARHASATTAIHAAISGSQEADDTDNLSVKISGSNLSGGKLSILSLVSVSFKTSLSFHKDKGDAADEGIDEQQYTLNVGDATIVSANGLHVSADGHSATAIYIRKDGTAPTLEAVIKFHATGPQVVTLTSNVTLKGGGAKSATGKVNVNIQKITWNDAVPEFFTTLKSMISSEVATGLKLHKTYTDLDKLSAVATFAYDGYRAANASNAASSLWGLHWEEAKIPPVVSSAAIAALGTRAISGILTNSRLVQAGVKGFQALSAAQKFALGALEKMSIYAAIADFAITQGLNVKEVYAVASTTTALGDFVGNVNAAEAATKQKWTDLDASFGDLEDLYKKYDKKEFTAADEAAKKTIMDQLNTLQNQVNTATTATDDFISKEDALITEAIATLHQLISPK